ncbi:MAG: hypothetical protein OXC07_09540 [Kistimonas sp.]|nr:hypothetical protein [Kistimonas sp.]
MHGHCDVIQHLLSQEASTEATGSDAGTLDNDNAICHANQPELRAAIDAHIE